MRTDDTSMGVSMSAPIETYHQACRLLEQVTYKPGYLFHLKHCGVGEDIPRGQSMWRFTPDYHLAYSDGDTILQLLASVQDSTSEEPRRIQVVSQTMLEPIAFRDGWHFMSWLRIVIGDFEAHERDEWLRVDGRRLVEPHAVDLRAVPADRVSLT